MRSVALNRTKLSKPRIEVEITDLETKLTSRYESIRKAAIAINSDIRFLNRSLQRSLLSLERDTKKSQIDKGINAPYRGRVRYSI